MRKLPSSARRRREIVVLPAPEGEDRMSISPRRLSLLLPAISAVAARHGDESSPRGSGKPLFARFVHRRDAAPPPAIEQGLGDHAAPHHQRARHRTGREPHQHGSRKPRAEAFATGQNFGNVGGGKAGRGEPLVEMPARDGAAFAQRQAGEIVSGHGYFLRPKSTVTTFEPSPSASGGCSPSAGESFSASSCGSGAMSVTAAWNCRPKSTAGSTNAVIAENGIVSLAGIELKLRHTVNPSASTPRSQNLFCSTIVISSGKRSRRCAGIVTPGAPVLNVM